MDLLDLLYIKALVSNENSSSGEISDEKLKEILSKIEEKVSYYELELYFSSISEEELLILLQ